MKLKLILFIILGFSIPTQMNAINWDLVTWDTLTAGQLQIAMIVGAPIFGVIVAEQGIVTVVTTIASKGSSLLLPLAPHAKDAISSRVANKMIDKAEDEIMGNNKTKEKRFSRKDLP